MSIRTANIEVSLQRLSILRIEHPQANPLKLACTLRAGESLPSGLTITAEIHTSRNVAAETTPLASSTVTVAADATSFEVSFDSPQTNQTVTPDSVRGCWMVVYGVADDDTVYTLSAADLLLGWHAISQVTAAPPNVTLFVEKGGVAWATGRDYQAGTMVTAGTTAYVASAGHTSAASTEPGEGASWETVWTVLSGGGGGATNLTTTVSPTQIVIVSSTGTDATIPAADVTNAGVMLPAQVTKLAGIATSATANATDAQLRDRSTHTGTQAISTIVNLQTSLDGKVESSSLGDLAFISSVGASRIDTGAVTEAKINDGAVTTTKINNAAVTNAKLANANAATIKSNLGGSSATPQDNSVEDVAAALPVFGSAQRGLVPAFGAGTNGRFVTPVGWGNTLAFGTLTASDPVVITQTWNNGSVVFAGMEMTITQTAANSSSYFVRFRGGAAGATDRFSVQIDGTSNQAGGAGWVGGSCGLATGPGFYLNDATARIQLGSSSNSPNLFRESDGAMSVRNSTAQMAVRVHDTYGSATDYHRVSIATVRASLSALSGASVTASALIPAGAIVVGVTAKVLTAITGATSWQLGTAADPDRFAAAGGIALGSTTDNRNWTSGALECFLTATDIILTANGSNFTAGAVYVSVQYIRGECD